jgi:hypothetical protein
MGHIRHLPKEHGIEITQSKDGVYKVKGKVPPIKDKVLKPKDPPAATDPKDKGDKGEVVE